MAETDLKFDEQEVCTKLAQEYLRSKMEFHSIGLECEKVDKYEIDQFLKKVYYVDIKPSELTDESEISDISKKFSALADKIKENAQLFCQLEFLLRKIPINDTNNVDLKLITQSLVYKSAFLNSDDITTYNVVPFHKDTPLFQLGLLAYQKPNLNFIIACSKETVAVCTLFVELCQNVGLEKAVTLAVLSEKDLKEYRNEFIEDMVGGCVGVVTARCDVDSAVDALLASTTRYPWKLSSVLVQEAAMERFARALEWKTRDAAAREVSLVLEPVAGEPRGVPVEAFRSTREALALLAARAPLAVAAWASDSAEAHEIALGVPAPLVWLNGQCQFDGPPAAAAALYCISKDDSTSEVIADVLGADALEELRCERAAWLQLAPMTRLERVRAVLQQFHAHSATQLDGAVGLRADSAFAVDSGICIVRRTPVELAIIDQDYIEQSFLRFLNYLVEGGVVLISSDREICRDVKLLSELLSKANVPVTDSDITSNMTTTMYKTKTIWISIGTIFAN
ncbi:uncharacterized protein LOC123875534 [Maniola jurtina]|uniref:uncharacterized protein LOC123875534 n=1 Tax=Maniola jurtina TaxID=191418 RepID=UPI001E68BAAB|nr:uncharacterized protein LOC123875534 [Maniola jurtina]XP_045777369.1 uncharacterized protein LOC123875534 [Maniola jurtina]